MPVIVQFDFAGLTDVSAAWMLVAIVAQWVAVPLVGALYRYITRRRSSRW